MQNLTLKKIVEFRSRSENGKRSLVKSWKRPPNPNPPEGGGDYWVSCVSALSRSFKENDLKYAMSRIADLEKRYPEAENKRTKDMYKRNIDVLSKYREADLKRWRPSKKLEFPKSPKRNATLTLSGLDVQLSPSQVFTFVKDETELVGGIWFIAKLNGFNSVELGMFSSILHRHLLGQFAKTHRISPRYCIAVDAFNKTEVNYTQLENDEISDVLEPTLEEIKSLL
jgi:hypothetical protein